METIKITLTIWGISIVVLLATVYLERKKAPKKTKRIQKTLIPLDYTGNDFESWLEYIRTESQIVKVLNGVEDLDDIILSNKLKSENIIKLI